jgi:hypothetical protein
LAELRHTTYVDDLEKHIRETYRCIRENETIRIYSDRPREEFRCRQEINDSWALIEEYLGQYIKVCQSLGKPIPEDIRQIATHFPEMVAEGFQQAVTELKQAAPDKTEALNRIVDVMIELRRFHEHLNEWKELHNLLQDLMICLTPLRDGLRSMTTAPGRWTRATSMSLWGPCRTKICQLESFAQNIKYIDDQTYCHEEKSIRGPAWMVNIVALRSKLEASLNEGDPQATFSSTQDLYNTCIQTLYRADKRLRDKVSELYALSNAILGGLQTWQT